MRADILDATEESFDRVIGINLKGPYFLTQLAARWMIDQRQADASVQRRDRQHLVGQRDRSLDQPRRLLHQQGRRRDGHAALGPPAGRVRHRRLRSPPGHHPHRHDAPPVAEKYDQLIAEGLTVENRWGEPEDVGRAVAMLARGELTYATGNVLNIDGGLTLRRL